MLKRYVNLRALSALLLAVLGASAMFGAEPAAKIKVLVVTGGHGFAKEPFFQMFKDNAEIAFTAAEQDTPPRTRVQEVASGEKGKRVFIIDSEERQAYELRMRTRSMEKVRVRLEKLQQRVAAGWLQKPEAIGAAAAGRLARPRDADPHQREEGK